LAKGLAIHGTEKIQKGKEGTVQAAGLDAGAKA
jgi:hypothetical protein